MNRVSRSLCGVTVSHLFGTSRESYNIYTLYMCCRECKDTCTYRTRMVTGVAATHIGTGMLHLCNTKIEAYEALLRHLYLSYTHTYRCRSNTYTGMVNICLSFSAVYLSYTYKYSCLLYMYTYVFLYMCSIWIFIHLRIHLSYTYVYLCMCCRVSQLIAVLTFKGLWAGIFRRTEKTWGRDLTLYIYIYMYIYIYICTYTYICVYIYMYLYIFT